MIGFAINARGLQRSWVQSMTSSLRASDLSSPTQSYGIDWSNIADQPAEISYRYAKKAAGRRQVRLRVPCEPPVEPLVPRLVRERAGSRARWCVSPAGSSVDIVGGGANIAATCGHRQRTIRAPLRRAVEVGIVQAN